jgi:hypothetical protein
VHFLYIAFTEKRGLGVCKVKNAQKPSFFAFFHLKGQSPTNS